MEIKKLKPWAGAKPRYGESMIRITFYARGEQVVWLRDQPAGVSRTLRDLIDKGMGVEEPDKA